MASCTGLSVLLVDACRALAIPARVVGTPRWTDNSGNHTWVEIWDNGWHFTGACEPNGHDLDKAWFIDRASQALRDDPLHAIYAVSYRRTGQNFPLVWARGENGVSAVNVTDRYTDQGAVGLLTGKRAVVFASRGGRYAGTPLDTQTGYVRDFLRFIGIEDVEFVYAEGLAMGEETKAAALAGARRELQRLAA